MLAAPDIELARARGDVGVERSARRAEKASPEWVKKAADLLRVGSIILNAQGPLFAEFTVEQVRLLVNKALPAPPDARAWCAPTPAAFCWGFIEPIKGKYRAAASSNGAPKQVYRKGPKA